MVAKWYFVIADWGTFVAKCWKQTWAKEEAELSGFTIVSAATLCLGGNGKLGSLRCGKKKKMSFLQACRWLFQEKQWYNIHLFFFQIEIFYDCYFFPMQMQLRGSCILQLTQSWLGAAETWLWHRAVLLEANTVPSALCQRPFPVHPVANELLLARAASKAPGHSSCSRAPFCALGRRNKCVVTVLAMLLARFGQAFDLLLKMYELL